MNALSLVQPGLMRQLLVKGVVLPAMVLQFSGCAWFSAKEMPVETTIVALTSKLQPWHTPVAAIPEQVDLVSQYRDLLSLASDPDDVRSIKKRVAELESIRLAMDPDAGAADLTTLAEDLTLLLDSSSDPVEAQQLRYELARVHAQLGQANAAREYLQTLSQQAVNELSQEAKFRLAEQHFSVGEIQAAELLYHKVASHPGRYQDHAHYMAAWSAFQNERYADAVEGVLSLLAAKGRFKNAPALKKDALRLAILGFDQQGGSNALDRAMLQRGLPDWQWPLYDALAEFYASKSRYLDGQQVWQGFLKQNPLHERAWQVGVALIDQARAEGFAEEAELLEASFVQRFERGGEYFETHGQQAFDHYSPRLKGILDQLGQQAHATAQASGEPADFLLAATEYERWLRNFPSDPAAVDVTYLLAEVLEQGGKNLPAIYRYREVAESAEDHPKAADAAYAVILLLPKLLPGEATAAQQLHWQLAFSRAFSEDSRANSVHLLAARSAFDEGDFSLASALSDEALVTWPAMANKDIAERISGHSHFELGEYELACSRYETLLTRAPANEAIRGRLMACLLARSQEAEAKGELGLAIQLLGQLTRLKPDSALAVDARFDTIALLERQADWQSAAAHLETFLADHSDAPAAVAQLPRLAGLFEKAGLMARAAPLWLAVSEGLAVEAKRGQALYRAAELFLETDNVSEAIKAFRHYAHNFPNPVGLRVEAMHHMEQLYLKTGELKKRRYWWSKQLAAWDSVAERGSDRHRYLAANVALHLARESKHGFDEVVLKLPLNQSLKRKRRTMEQALDAFTRAGKVGYAPVTSEALHEAANLYQSFAQSLMNSERPPNLEADTLAQYDLLLEEQAFEFELEAIERFEQNLNFGRRAGWDDWTEQSLLALSNLAPAKFRRSEAETEVEMARGN